MGLQNQAGNANEGAGPATSRSAAVAGGVAVLNEYLQLLNKAKRMTKMLNQVGQIKSTCEAARKSLGALAAEKGKGCCIVQASWHTQSPGGWTDRGFRQPQGAATKIESMSVTYVATCCNDAKPTNFWKDSTFMHSLLRGFFKMKNYILYLAIGFCSCEKNKEVQEVQEVQEAGSQKLVFKNELGEILREYNIFRTSFGDDGAVIIGLPENKHSDFASFTRGVKGETIFVELGERRWETVASEVANGSLMFFDEKKIKIFENSEDANKELLDALTGEEKR